MATALFITPTDIKQNTLIDMNLDTDKFIQFIKIAQQIHIQNYLGGQLYNKISDLIINGELGLPANAVYKTLVNEYLKDMLIHFAMVDYLPFAAYSVANSGIYKKPSENQGSATKSEIDALVDKHREFAQFYTRRFLDFICYNESDYPEYSSAQEGEMEADTGDAIFTGWVL